MIYCNMGICGKLLQQDTVRGHISPLIGASFLVLATLNPRHHAVNVVNVAGKNRLLTNQVQTELDYVMFHADRNIDPERVFHALNSLEENILFLRDGGTFLGIKRARFFPCLQMNVVVGVRIETHYMNMPMPENIVDNVQKDCLQRLIATEIHCS